MPNDVLGSDDRVRVAKSARPPAVGRDRQRSNNTSLRREPLDSAPEKDLDSSRASLLGQVTVTELLDGDERPIFIIDLENQVETYAGTLKTLFVNGALRSLRGLLDKVCGVVGDSSGPTATTEHYQEFKAWMMERGDGVDSFKPRSSFEYASCTWRGRFLGKHNRLKAITATHLQSSTLVGRQQATDSWQSTAESPLDHKREDRTKRLVQSGSAPDHDPQVLGKNSSCPPTPPPPQPQLIDLSTKHPASSARVLEVGGHSVQAVAKSSTGGFFDWTRLPNTQDHSPHIQFILNTDWASTSLGPIETWPWELRLMCNLIMASPFAAAFYWGDDLVTIYNEAYIPLAGQKHPRLMGSRYRDGWAEIWTDVECSFIDAKMTAKATYKEDDRFYMWRNGFLEEAYFDWQVLQYVSLIPIIGSDGSVCGHYNPAFEKTRRIISERRMLTLREIGERTASARDVKSFWVQVLRGLEDKTFDFPFVVLYSVSDDDGDSVSTHSGSVMGARQCHLEGSLGVPRGHAMAPERIDLKTGSERYSPIFREAMRTGNPIHVKVEDGSLAMEGLQVRGYPEPCRAAVVCPIYPTSGESVLGFLVIGINQRKTFDEEYSLFVQLLSRQCSATVASVVLFEDEIRQSQKAAKLAAEDRIAMANQLAERTQEAAESENRFTKIWENAPVGMFIADSKGRMTYCNDMFYDISRHSRELGSADEWMDFVKEEDMHLVQRLFTDLLEKKIPSSAEFRFKTRWHDKKGHSGDTWVLFSAYPESDQNGVLKSVFGCLTNISGQKRAENIQREKREEAVELKRQQENFIDITSHEIRNPLGAVILCADELSSSLMEFKAEHETQVRDQLDDCIEAAQTIQLCAQHQKRIINDVLTLSKLDSALLLVTPVDAQPKSVVQKALKMFESEAQSAGVNLEFFVEDSFVNGHVDWVRLDPSRLLQVLINLITNAIKFTSTQKVGGKVSILLGASRQRPSKGDENRISYFPAARSQADVVSFEEWGKGEILYLHFAVKDTGSGLDDSEKKLLFQRFSQASPRTHVTYGGSGLGLYISKHLVELQGGEIGVSSSSGHGSTFAFWIQSRRSTGARNAWTDEGMPPVRKLSGTNFAPGALSPSTAKATETTSTVPSATPTTIHVLIVEDNLVNSRVLTKQLQKHGLGVTVANHGGEALDVLRGCRYWQGNREDAPDISLILMDLEMPVMDGLMCTRTIRELEKQGQILRSIPIIAVSANARIEQVNHARETGVNDVVSKPFRVVTDLLPKIRSLAGVWEV